jgi:hypothetical protein
MMMPVLFVVYVGHAVGALDVEILKKQFSFCAVHTEVPLK